MTGTTKFKVEKSNRKGKFNSWQSRIIDLLSQQDLNKILLGREQKLEDTDGEQQVDLEMREIRMILHVGRTGEFVYDQILLKQVVYQEATLKIHYGRMT